MISIPLWLTAEHACSYLDDRYSRSTVVDPDFMLNPQLYSRLIEQGFRRSGDQVYKPYCRSCQACVPTRLPVAYFLPDRKQKRCAKRNAQTRVSIKPAEFDPRHFELYSRYQAARHDKGETSSASPREYLHFLGSSWCDTWFVEFSISGKLAAVAVVDVLDHALSAVYTFFDPEFSDYSPGVFAVLWQIEQARKLNLEYLYLGFWVKDCRKMSYKNQYQPLQGLIGQQWQPIS
jgi:leucyl-tRNA---protein transferase